MTRVDGTGLSPLQNSINSVLDTLTAGTSQANKTPATVINRALDSFQSVNFEAGQLSFAQLNALPTLSNAASFADPASFYKAQESNSAVFQELKNPAFQPAPNLKRLSDDLRNFQGNSFFAGEKQTQYSMAEMTPVEVHVKGEPTLKEQLDAKKKELLSLRQEIIRKEAEIAGKEKGGAIQATKVGEDPESVFDFIPGFEAAEDIFDGPDEEIAPGPPADLSEEMKQLQELKRKEEELEGQIKELANQIEQIQQGSQQQFSDFKISQRSLAVDNSSPSVRTAFNEALLNFQGVIDLQLQFDSQRLFSQRFSSIRA